LLKAAPDRQVGTEHLVEFEEHSGSVIKLTVPPKFGLISRVLTHPVPNLRGEPGSRQAIEFVPATPLEYLERWMAANEVLGDAVRLTAVIRWADGQVSFAIRQPHYAGVPASEWEIEAGFRADGWTPIRDPGGQHRLFYHHAWQVLAIDALPRNCYIRDGALQPFDVILCRPDAELESHLALYPDDG
jgi:hypothetical protein